MILRTLRFAVATALFLSLLETSLGGAVLFLSSSNAIARHILEAHRAEGLLLALRLALFEAAAGAAFALLLHPLLPGRRAAFSVLLLFGASLLHVATRGTRVLFGPVHAAAVSFAGAVPSAVKALYRPEEPLVLLAGLAAWGAVEWARRMGARRSATFSLATLALWGGLRLHERDDAERPPAPRGGPPNVVLVAADSLRADRLSCYGHGRRTSPAIDRLARRGVLFEQALVPTASTFESWVSLLSSLEPRDHGLRHMFPSRRLLAEVRSRCAFLPEVLREAGYETAVVGGWCGAHFELLDFGFDEVDVTNAQTATALLAEGLLTCHLPAVALLENPLGRAWIPEAERVSFARPPAAITGRALSLVDRLSATGRPFFLVVVHDVTHLPYAADWPYPRLFSRPGYSGRHRWRIDVDVDRLVQRGFESALEPEEIEHVRDLYDGCVREFDDAVAALLKGLEERGLLEHTIVGVLADHGDDLYEPGTTLGHGVTLFGGDQANRIPAVFAGPRVPRGARVPGLARSIDLAPTLLGWLDLRPPRGWRGFDLSTGRRPAAAVLETSYLLYRQPVPDLRPDEEPLPFPRVDRAVFCDHAFDCNLVLAPSLEDDVVRTKCFAVRRGPWKLVVVPGRHRPIVRLFDLDADPHMERDLARDRPEVVRRLAAFLPERIDRSF